MRSLGCTPRSCENSSDRCGSSASAYQRIRHGHGRTAFHVLTAKIRRLAGDPSDIHAAVLAGFVAELGETEMRHPRIMLRLRWVA